MNINYGAYGTHRGNGQACSAYAGNRFEANTGWYLLGRRPYSPVLRRFLSPDAVSPFDAGGINRYAYCGGDPINRIDPSGNVFMQWLRSSLGLSDSLTSNITHSLENPSAASSQVASGIATPGTLTATSASTTDIPSPLTAVMASGASSEGTSPGRVLYGHAGGDSAKALSGPATARPLRNDLDDHYVGQRVLPNGRPGTSASAKRQGHTVNVVEQPNWPAHRIDPKTGGKTLTVNWQRYLHSENPRSSIWAADTEINSNIVSALVDNLAQQGTTEAYLYTSAHGDIRGKNWANRSGMRYFSEPEFFLEDLLGAKVMGKSLGLDVRIDPVTLMTRDTFRERLRNDGTHILGFCYGIADEVFMSAANLNVATVYDGSVV